MMLLSFKPQSSHCFLKSPFVLCQCCPIVSVVLQHVFVPGRLVDMGYHVYRMFGIADLQYIPVLGCVMFYWHLAGCGQISP